MTVQAVHWHEGMFLRPHHFQLDERFWTEQANRCVAWDHHYCWGLRSIDLDTAALSNYRLVVRSLQARMADGTLVAAPGDVTLPVRDLRAALARESSLTVYLALPLMQAARANVANGGDAAARFLIDRRQVEDENTGLDSQEIEVRLLNVRLLFSHEDHSGYEVLPIARIRRADRAESLPQLDETYIPPLLACDAWTPLQTGNLQAIYDRLGRKMELLASQATSRGITFDSQGQGDRLLFEQLKVMNEGYTTLASLLFAQGVPPLPMYRDLCQLVGRLAIFGPERRAPKLPQYDHDDLGGCFWRAKQYIDQLLDVVVEPDYRERALVGAGLRMQVALEPAWLESSWQLFVGVQSSLPPEQTVRLLTSGLDMKIGSSERVDDIFRLGQAGLRFNFAAHPPRALPANPGLVYFAVDRGSQADEWSRVEQSLSLAVRLNENLIVSNIQGQRALSIRVDGQTVSMTFTLYVTPRQAAG